MKKNTYTFSIIKGIKNPPNANNPSNSFTVGNGLLHNGLSGSLLKYIAIITMTIDHIGAAIVEQLLYHSIQPNTFTFGNFIITRQQLIYLDCILRSIGRIAFPIFCFLLVEGFFYTKSRMRYLKRLVLFALLSEIPFDLAFSHSLFNISSQNVFFTLYIGFIAMCLQEYWKSKPLLRISSAVFCMLFAYLAHTDYHALGILAILLFYYFRTLQKPFHILWVLLYFFSWEPMAILSSIFLIGYNGKKGNSYRYFFYCFYPLHLLCLYGIYRLISM